MGYTHSWNQDIPAPVISVVNQVFQAALGKLESTQKLINLASLFKQAKNREADDERGRQMTDLLNENFCETAWDDDNNFVLMPEHDTSYEFIKTNRMKYDAAVYTALSLLRNCVPF
jgi:hypothetical protein